MNKENDFKVWTYFPDFLLQKVSHIRILNVYVAEKRYISIKNFSNKYMYMYIFTHT